MLVGPSGRNWDHPHHPMVGDIEILAVDLCAAASDRDALHEFYAGRLGLSATAPVGDAASFAAGPARLSFRDGASGTRPYYHFALLVPGNRFDAALEWAAAAAPPLPYQGDPRVRFDDWDAEACYVHDPAGNIVELIAHHGVAGSSCTGAFEVSELRGISEIGLVLAAPVPAIGALERAGLPMWAGDAPAQGEVFAFVGRKAHTAIVSSEGHPWLPTSRPAEIHPLTATVTVGGGPTSTVTVTAGGRLAIA